MDNQNKKNITNRQQELLSIIYHFLRDSGYPPTFEEMREELHVISNQSVIDHLRGLVDAKCIRKNQSAARGLSILPHGYAMLGRPPLAPVLGMTTAGTPVEALELDGEFQEIPSVPGEMLHQFNEEVFLLKVHGDSMINANIDDGDTVLVQSKKFFSSGEVVLARVGDGRTIKRYISVDEPPYTYLKPENPQYPIILFKDDVELEGKVISVIKGGQWKSVK